MGEQRERDRFLGIAVDSVIGGDAHASPGQVGCQKPHQLRVARAPAAGDQIVRHSIQRLDRKNHRSGREGRGRRHQVLERKPRGNQARDELAEVDLQLCSDAPELVAEALRRAAEILATITGDASTEALLGEIFARFCIGK